MEMEKKSNDSRLYVLISDRLAPIYGAVQGGHSIAQWMLEHSDNPAWKNDTVVYLSCDIYRMMVLLDGEDFSVFHEPDIDNETTAIAIIGNERNQRLFRRLKLLK